MEQYPQDMPEQYRHHVKHYTSQWEGDPREWYQGPGWYFWNELQDYAYGPYTTCERACRELDAYARELDQPKHHHIMVIGRFMDGDNCSLALADKSRLEAILAFETWMFECDGRPEELEELRRRERAGEPVETGIIIDFIVTSDSPFGTEACQ